MSNYEFPEVFESIFKPARFKVYYGGRGSGKSWAVARWLIIKAFSGTERILCTREFQNSIKDSVHRLLSDQIDEMGLFSQFTITQNEIRSMSGSEIIFKGLHHNAAEIKSMEGITLCWIEEAEKTSEQSLDFLIPTIRAPGSEIIITFNPFKETDPVYRRYVQNSRPDWIIQRVNYTENPWFPDVLKTEMEWDRETNPDKHGWIWLGNCLGISEAQVYKGKYEVMDFETPAETEFYFGADWGFSQDPTTLVRCWIKDKCLYIDYEAGGVGVEIDNTPSLFDQVPESRKWVIEADSARPETISYMKRNGFPKLKGVKKWPGSVEEGVNFIKSFRRIYIHPRCRKTLEEFELYQYKVDTQTGKILPILVDANNHYQDAIRYALSRHIKQKRKIGSGVSL